jgi:hypothetical protein
MATLEQLHDALVNADKAGDTEAARILADEIVRLQTTQQPQQPSETHLGADRRLANDAQVAEQTAVGRREAYAQKPWYSQALQASDDEARLIGNPFGIGDKFAARMNSLTGDLSYEDQLRIEKNRTQAARDRAAAAAIPSEIMGDVLAGGAVAGQGATLAGRFNTANMTGIKGVLARAGLMAPEGALYGVADALGRDTDVKTAAVTGAIAGPVGSIVGDTVSKVASKVLPAKTASAVPALEKLKTQADDAYKAADNAGVVINPQSVQRLKANVEAKLVDFGYHPQNQPGVKAALDEIDRISQGNVTLKGLDILRRVAKNANSPTNPSQSAASQIVVNEIDDFMKGLKPQDVVMGDKKAGINSLLKARELWTRVRKNEKLVDAIESAALRAASTGSGGNVENATRQNLRRMIDPTSSSRVAWTVDEKKAIEEIVRGTPTQNALRLLGKLSPQGNGLMAALGVGGAMTNPLLGIPSLAGLGAKHIADKGVQQGIQALDELIRVGGSKQALQAAQATLRSLSQTQREAIARIVQTAIIQAKARSEAPAQ